MTTSRIKNLDTKSVVLDTVALRLNQHGRDLYLFSLTAARIRDLIASKKLDIDRWSPENPDGYQRVPTESRYKRFGRYAASAKGICPVSILLAVRNRNQVDVEELDEEGTVRLRIDGDATIYVPDGQHRAFGLGWAVDQPGSEVADYQIPTVLFLANGDDPRYEEAQQFYTINSNSKRVRTDLAQRYLLRKREKELGALEEETAIPTGTLKELEPYAVKVADLLNEKGPWENKIEPANMSVESASISQASFVESLKPLIARVSELYWTVGKTKAMVDAFWNAVRYKCPQAFAHWTDDSCEEDNNEHFDAVLVKTAGVFSLNDVLARTLPLADVAQAPTSPETFKKLLSKASLEEYFTDGRDGYWSSNSTQDNSAASRGTGRKSFKAITDEIWEAMVGA